VFAIWVRAYSRERRYEWMWEKTKSYPEEIDVLYCQNKLIWLYMTRSGRYKDNHSYAQGLSCMMERYSFGYKNITRLDSTGNSSVQSMTELLNKTKVFVQAESEGPLHC
jgi:hypothetical protein